MGTLDSQAAPFVQAVNSLAGPQYTARARHWGGHLLAARRQPQRHSHRRRHPRPGRGADSGCRGCRPRRPGTQLGATGVAVTIPAIFTAALSDPVKKQRMGLATAAFRACFTGQVIPGSSAGAARLKRDELDRAGGTTFRVGTFVNGLEGAMTGANELGGFTAAKIGRAYVHKYPGNTREKHDLAVLVFNYAARHHQVQGPLLSS